ncbi:TetR-like C-terminal domain-containing protein [Nocardia altamirensis]|uniref:TetR-like C-terminal domain-containing protein n=1 Tax=Nocardia altamirensis TaxID=472158 RepID=UPI000840376E|nr:TetR-like C-terminal domain-containing protein [Nocardia altamirensis]
MGSAVIAETDDLHADLVAWARVFLQRTAEPATRAALPGLMSAYHRSPDRYRALQDRADLPVRKALAERIASALPADESGTADLVFDILVARSLVRGLIHGLDDAETFCTRTADALLAIICAAGRPRPPTRKSTP